MSAPVHAKSSAKILAKDSPSLRDALYHTVHDATGGAKALADLIGVRHGYLLDAVNPDRDDVQFQLRLAAPLMNATQALDGVRCCLIADVIERQIGRVAFPLPTGANLDAAQANAVLQFGEYLTESAAATSDSTVTPAEAERCEKQGQDAIAAICACVANMRQRAGLPAIDGPRVIAR